MKLLFIFRKVIPLTEHIFWIKQCPKPAGEVTTWPLPLRSSRRPRSYLTHNIISFSFAYLNLTFDYKRSSNNWMWTLGPGPLDSSLSRLSRGTCQLGFAVSQTTSKLSGSKQQVFVISHDSVNHLDGFPDRSEGKLTKDMIGVSCKNEMCVTVENHWDFGIVWQQKMTDVRPQTTWSRQINKQTEKNR